MIVENLKKFIDSKGISIAAFEKSIGMSNNSFRKSLNSGGNIGSDKLENILKIYPDLNPSWVLTGNGEMLITSNTEIKNGHPNGHLNSHLSENIDEKDAYLTEKLEPHVMSLGMVAAETRTIYGESRQRVAVKLRKEQMRIPKLLEEKTRISVPFYNLPVSAGQLGILESEVLAQSVPDGFVELSVFEGCEAIFPITGISMEPIISSGDWIGIRTIDNLSHSWEFLQTGAIYLIITREERMIKFIEKANDEDFIICKSPNYSPFKVFKGDILKLYRVKACSKRL